MSETPQDFDFNAWLEGAERPERAVTVYQRAGLIADLDALEAQILAADEDGEDVDGPSMGGGVGKLRAEYAKLAKQFHDSALTIRLHGHSDEEKREFLGDQPEGVVYRVLADAFTAPKATADQVKLLEKKLGPAQFGLILEAYQKASTEIPSVSADFLPKPSTRGDGGE